VAQIQSRHLDLEELVGEARAYANVAKWTSLVAILYSVVILALILLYIVFYAIFIVVILNA